MMSAFIVFVVAVAIVVTYILTVNRFLRSDENWNDPTAVRPPAQPVETSLPRNLATARA